MYQSFKSQPNTIMPTGMMTTCSTYRSAGADSGISVWASGHDKHQDAHIIQRYRYHLVLCGHPPPFPEFTPDRLGIETAALFLS